MNEAEKANQANWNRLALLHAESDDYYDVAGFKAGQTSLRPLEIEELGSVKGKSLLHLQCHFGMDTLSWARLGATVTGVDYAENAIELARVLSRETGQPAEFVRSAVFDLPQALNGEFDIVFTSYGVLCWLSELSRWAAVIDHFLKPGGTFYMVECHPVANIFFNEKGAKELQIAYPYFHRPAPEIFTNEDSYGSQAPGLRFTTYEWAHSLSDIINALLGIGLRLEFVHEFPFNVYAQFPFMIRSPDGWWRLPKHQESVPQLFSIKALKPMSQP